MTFPKTPKKWWALIGVFLGLLASFGTADAEIVVKARAFLTDTTAAANGRVVHVGGVLRDNIGQPVVGTTLRVTLGSGPQTAVTTAVKTDTEGAFATTSRATADGRQTVSVTFEGNALLGASTFAAELDIGRQTVELHFEADALVEAESPGGLTVGAQTPEHRPLPNLPLGLKLDGQQVPASLTNSDGQIHVRWPQLPSGNHTLVATFAGDLERLPVTREHRFMAQAALGVALRPLNLRLPLDTPLVLEGRVTGAPAGTSQITVLANGEPVAETATDPSGAFVSRIAFDDLPAGQVRVQVIATSPDAAHRPGFSPAVLVELETRAPPSPAWLLAPLTLSALALGGSALRRRPPVVARPVDLRDARNPVAFTFVASEAPRTASLSSLKVQVRSAIDGLPIAGADVRLLASGLYKERTKPRVDEKPTGVAQAVTDAGGEASISGEGEYVWVSAPGHAPASYRCPCPPGGHAVLPLLPRRAFAQRLLEGVLAAAGRPPLVFGRVTPTEAGLFLSQRGLDVRAAVELPAMVERSCFGPDEPQLDALAHLESESERATLALETAKVGS